MKRQNSILFLILVVSLARTGMAQQASDSTWEVAERVASYIDAFNRCNVAACANHWSESAEYVIAGAAKPIEGQEAIRKALKKLLSTDDEFQLAVGDQRFRKVSDDVVMEEGTARLVSETHGTEYARYLVVHVRQRPQPGDTALGKQPGDIALADHSLGKQHSNNLMTKCLRVTLRRC